MAHILLIDDDDSVRSVIRRLLEQMGHQVREAADGKAGIEAYVERPAQLVVTDVIMPEQDGLGAIYALRQHDPEVRILAMSGGGFCLDADDCLSQARALGAQATLSKPFRSTELAAAVQDALRDEA